METSLKVAKFMESPHMPPLLRQVGTHHHFLFSPKTRRMSAAKQNVYEGDQFQSSRSLHLNKVRAEVFPWEQYAEVLTNHSLTSLPATR